MASYRLIVKPVEWLRRWQEEYGPTFTINRLGMKVVITSDPDLIKQLYAVKDQEMFEAALPEQTDVLLGEGSVLLLAGEQHRQVRKLMTAPFHGERMQRWAGEIAGVARRVFSESESILAFERAQQATLEVIVRVIFGVTEDSRCREFTSVMKEWASSISIGFLFMRVFQRKYFGLSSYARFKRLSDEVDALLYEQIRRARELGDDASGRGDILTGLVNARFEDGSSMTDASIRAQLRTLLFAGHDTTAITIAWTLYYLMKNRPVLERVRAELSTVPEDANPSSFARLPYLGAVFEETLRIRPVTPDAFRLLRKPWRLGKWNLPAGVAVCPMAPLTHLRDDLWSEPEEFRPERFLEGQRGPGTYYPFGGGARRCLGATFAQFEYCIIMATLLREFEFELLEDDVRWGRNVATLQPLGGIPMRVIRKAQT